MFVVYKCEECGADVNSDMEFCPKCDAELPEFTLERDYDAELDQEEYELEHPIRTKLRKFFGSYGEHLEEVIIREAEKEEEETVKIERLREEKGFWAVRWYELKRFLKLLSIAILLLAWIVLSFILFSEIENELLSLVIGGVMAFLPLFGISVWLLMKNDEREIPTRQKIKKHAWGAFNKLLFAIVFLVLVFFVIFLLRVYILEPAFNFVWDLFSK